MSADTLLERALWPASQLGDALITLARSADLRVRPTELPSVSRHAEIGIAAWLEGASRMLGLEAEPTSVLYGDVELAIRSAGPAVLEVERGSEPRFLALVRSTEHKATLVATDGEVVRIPISTVAALLRGQADERLRARVLPLLDRTGVVGPRREVALRALIRNRFHNHRLPSFWVLREPAGTSFVHEAKREGVVKWLLVMLGAHACSYGAWLGSWAMIGQGLLAGSLDVSWLYAWVLLLVLVVPFQALATWAQGRSALLGGAVLKQRLLAGILAYDSDVARRQGVGGLLGRVIESEAVGNLAMAGGLLGLVASLELASTLVVLVSAGANLLAALLVVWTAMVGLQCRRAFRERSRWTRTRLSMTHGLIEQMVGHRTRLVQEAPEDWHDGEDQVLSNYVDTTRGYDRATALLTVLPRGWLCVGVAGIAYSLVHTSPSSPSLVVAFGGMLLGFQAFTRLTAGMNQLLGAAVAWEQAKPLLDAVGVAEQGYVVSAISAFPAAERRGTAIPHVEAVDVDYSYRDRGRPVLRGCSFALSRGEHALLEGSSGGGKSTLGTLLAGLRAPDSGLLLLDGIDLRTLRLEGWRKRVATAPQFHENHIFSGTLAFNLLLGGRWPASSDDMEEAETLCRELGLGDLIDRMPSGLEQALGDTGWQLSHGERSRVYIARTLLQRTDLIVLDESFAALDPETLEQALSCVLARSATVLVIAHP